MTINAPSAADKDPPKEILKPIPYISAETNIGRNPNRVEKGNQDAFSVYYPGLVVVADGVGGARRGDFASKSLCFRCRNPDYLIDDFLKVHHQVNLESARINVNMQVASTVVAAAEDLEHPNTYTVYNVGDSPAYVFDTNTNTYTEVTIRDEKEVNNPDKTQYFDRPNPMVLTSSVGGGRELDRKDIHHRRVTLEKGKFLILMTDGLSDYLDWTPGTVDKVMNILRTDSQNPAKDMVNLALECGGKDNVTVAVIAHHQ